MLLGAAGLSRLTLLSGAEALDTANVTPVAAAIANNTVATTPISLPTAHSCPRWCEGVNLPVGNASHNTLNTISPPAADQATTIGHDDRPSGGSPMVPGTRYRSSHGPP